MAANDTLCFSNFDGVTGQPKVDGFFLADEGIFTHETEPGYVSGSRMTFGGSGFAPAVFQGVKAGNFLHLAFMCRGDLSFDAEDVIVVALAPTTNPSQADTRRIDIFPVFEGVGADETLGGTGGPAGTDDDVPAGVPAGHDYHIRTNHNAAKLIFWRGQAAGDPWASYTPATYTPSAPPGAPTGPYQVRVRSWVPPTSPPNGEFAWSIELRIPIGTAQGGADWIDLADGFGLYFNVIRVVKTAIAPTTPSQGWWSTQFRFPQEDPANTLTGHLNATLSIPSGFYGTGLIPALQVPPGSNLGQGVRFATGSWGQPLIGRRAAGSSTLTLGHTISKTEDNELVAVVDNTSPTAAANGVKAEIRFANWGLGAGDFFSWAKPPGLSPNPSAPANLTAPATNVPLVCSWPAADVPSDYAPPKQHQCMWVQLTSGSAVNFVQSSARKNMDFINLSTFERPAEISGVGYPPPAGASTDHEFLLFTRTRKIVVPDVDRRKTTAGASGDDPSDRVFYLWLTEGYRRTYEMLTIDGRQTEVLDETPGAYGYVAEHTGAADELAWEFTGPGVESHAAGVHTVPVPHGGSVTIHNKLWTRRAAMKKWPWWLWLLLVVLVLVLIVVFGT